MIEGGVQLPVDMCLSICVCVCACVFVCVCGDAPVVFVITAKGRHKCTRIFSLQA